MRVLHLSWNRIGLDGAKALAAAVDSKALKLRELNLQNNRAIDNGGAVAFMRAIEHNQHLTKLWLSGTQVGLLARVLERERGTRATVGLQVKNNRRCERELRRLLEYPHTYDRTPKVDDAYAAHLNALLARGPESRKLLAEVAVLLEDCALLGALDAVHEELGVEALQDLAHVSRADLKDVRGLKPVRRQSSNRHT